MPPRPSQRVTLQTIADETGVSYMTVARVLSGKTKSQWPSVARRANEIRQAAERLGYRPNASARATVSGRFNAMALLYRRAMGDLQGDLQEGVFRECESRNVHVVVSEANIDGDDAPDQAPKLLRELCVDGLIVHYAARIDPHIIDQVRESNLPVVWVNTKQKHGCVYPDELGVGRRIVRHLASLGHRRIAYVGSSIAAVEAGSFQGHYSVADRYLGVRDAGGEAGLRVKPVEVAQQTPQDDLTAIRAALSGNDRPTALVINGRDQLMAALIAAASLGLSVPRDVSLIAFTPAKGRTYWSQAVGLAVTPMIGVGVAAAAMLQRMVESPRQPQESAVVPYSPLAVDHLAPPPGS